MCVYEEMMVMIKDGRSHIFLKISQTAKMTKAGSFSQGHVWAVR